MEPSVSEGAAELRLRGGMELCYDAWIREKRNHCCSLFRSNLC